MSGVNIVRIPADGAEVLITSERPLSTAAWAAVAEIAEAATRLAPGTVGDLSADDGLSCSITEADYYNSHPMTRRIDLSLAKDEMGERCMCCVMDSGACRCVLDCGSLHCTGWADTRTLVKAEDPS